MDDFNKMSEGKDRISGNIVSFAIVGTVAITPEPCVILEMTLDCGYRVYSQATKAVMAHLLARQHRTATFVGELFGDEKQKLDCDAVFFWDEDNTPPNDS